MLRTIIICCFIALSSLTSPAIQSAETPEPVQQVTNFDSFELPPWFKVSFLDLSEDLSLIHI